MTVSGSRTAEFVVNGRETSVSGVEQREKRDCPSTKALKMKRAAAIYKPLDICRRVFITSLVVSDCQGRL